MSNFFTTAAKDRPLRLALRVDATATTGLGHAVRVAGIVAEIAAPLQLVIIGDGEALTTLFPGAEYHQAPTDNRPLAAVAAAVNAEAILVDLPTYADHMWSTGEQLPAVIVIDDYGGSVQADLVINGTVLDEYHHYARMTDPSRLRVGPSYSLVRAVFGRTPWQEQAAQGITVVAGSGVRAREWAMMLTSDAMDRTGWKPITVIVGLTFEHINDLKSQCAHIGATLKVGVSAEVLASSLAGARLALITGGMIVYEALAVGVPAIVFPQVPNLPPEAKWLAERDCIHDLGYDAGMNPSTVASAVTRLLSNQPLAKHLSEQSRHLIDGQGMLRAAAAITELIRTADRQRTP